MNEYQYPIESLAPFAHYIWWKTTEEALEFPERLIAQVMNRGTYEDVCQLLDIVGEKTFLDILTRAETGEFNERSWAYWHYRLNPDITLGQVPPMPARRYHDEIPT